MHVIFALCFFSFIWSKNNLKNNLGKNSFQIYDLATLTFTFSAYLLPRKKRTVIKISNRFYLNELIFIHYSKNHAVYILNLIF
jgi:hypothetical protein